MCASEIIPSSAARRRVCKGVKMRAGAFFQYGNYNDWDRYKAKSDAPQQVTDQQILDEDLALAELVEPLGFDSYWAIDHYITPYGMTGGVLQHLTYMAGR